jgi:hypothetical protein
MGGCGAVRQQTDEARDGVVHGGGEADPRRAGEDGECPLSKALRGGAKLFFEDAAKKLGMAEWLGARGVATMQVCAPRSKGELAVAETCGLLGSRAGLEER